MPSLIQNIMSQKGWNEKRIDSNQIEKTRNPFHRIWILFVAIEKLKVNAISSSISSLRITLDVVVVLFHHLFHLFCFFYSFQRHNVLLTTRHRSHSVIDEDDNNDGGADLPLT